MGDDDGGGCSSVGGDGSDNAAFGCSQCLWWWCWFCYGVGGCGGEHVADMICWNFFWRRW